MTQGDTPNYGLAGGVCSTRNIHSAQLRREIEQIERDLIELKKADPAMYHMGDFDELLDAHKVLTDRLKGSTA
jgi:hypothetical protein